LPLLADASSIAVVASPCIPTPRRSQRRATPFFSNLLGIGRSRRDRGVSHVIAEIGGNLADRVIAA